MPRRNERLFDRAMPLVRASTLPQLHQPISWRTVIGPSSNQEHSPNEKLQHAGEAQPSPHTKRQNRDVNMIFQTDSRSPKSIS